MNPQARKDRLVIEELPEETLIYDQERHKAHCLNQSAAFVCSRCDGQTSVAGLAKALEDELGIPAAGETVRLALDRLGRAHLLEQRERAERGSSRYSRRRVVKTLAKLGFAVPMVISIVSPLSAQVASCITQAQCVSLLPAFCGGLPICTQQAKCCLQHNGKCKKRNCP